MIDKNANIEFALLRARPLKSFLDFSLCISTKVGEFVLHMEVMYD